VNFLSQSDHGAIAAICGEDSIDNIVELLRDRNQSFGWEYLAYTTMVALSTRSTLLQHDEIKMTDPKIALLFHFLVVEILCKAHELMCMSTFPGCLLEDPRDIRAFVDRIRNQSETKISDIKLYCILNKVPYPNYCHIYFDAPITAADESEEEDYEEQIEEEAADPALRGMFAFGSNRDDEEEADEGSVSESDSIPV